MEGVHYPFVLIHTYLPTYLHHLPEDLETESAIAMVSEEVGPCLQMMKCKGVQTKQKARLAALDTESALTFHRRLETFED